MPDYPQVKNMSLIESTGRLRLHLAMFGNILLIAPEIDLILYAGI